MCYAEPTKKKTTNFVPKTFNSNTHAKDIKGEVGVIFVDKEQFKSAVRNSSMTSGRSYKYLTDDKGRMHIVCAQGCPFKMWVSYIKEKEGWQIKTLADEHNCVWTCKNKLVTVKYLEKLFGDRIRKNPNWKLSEMQDEFKRVLKVDICEAKCCRVRQKALLARSCEKNEGTLCQSEEVWGGGEILRSNRNNTMKISTIRLQELERASKGAAEKMKELNPAVWSKAYFGTHSCTDSTENNMSECFNSWILKERYMSIIDMFVEIHDKLMARIHEKRDDMVNKDCIIVPIIKKMPNYAIKESVGYKVLWDGRENYTVKNTTCSCRVWEVTEVPCTHAVSAIQHSRKKSSRLCG